MFTMEGDVNTSDADASFKLSHLDDALNVTRESCTDDYAVCVIKSVLIVSLGICTVVSNAVFLYVVRTDSNLQTTANLYAVSLAVADLLVGLIVIPPNIIDIWRLEFWRDIPNWPHSIWVTLDFYFTIESILNFVLLNLDRFWSINSPFKYMRKRSRRKTIMYIATTWGIGMVVIISPAIMWSLGFSGLIVPSKTKFYRFGKSAWLICMNAVLLYFVPLLVLCAIYCKIFRALNKRTNLDIGRSSITSTAFSNKNSSSRRNSEHTAVPQTFISESELKRLRSIYDRTIKRERTERHRKIMFPRRSKRRYDASGVELKTYDSIEEENDDLQDSEDSNDDRCVTLDEYEGNENSIYNNYSRRKSVCNSQNSRRSNSVSDISGNGEKSSMAQFQCRRCHGCHQTTTESVGNGNTCSGDEPRPLKMPNIEQIKKFGGVVCPKCSQLFTRIGFIKESDLHDDSMEDNSPPSLDSKILFSDNDHKTFQGNIYINDRFDSKHSFTNHSKEIDQLLYQEFVPKLNGETPIFSSDLLVKETNDVHPYKPRQKDHSQSFSHVPSRPNGEVGPKLSSSMGDVRSRVRQSFQNSFSALSEKGNRAFNILRQQEKAAKQLSVTLSCLFLCWTPYFVQVILYSIYPQTANYKFLAVSVYLGYFHSLCNPILFVIFNLKFQRAFKKAMCCFPRDDKRKPYIPKQPSAL